MQNPTSHQRNSEPRPQKEDRIAVSSSASSPRTIQTIFSSRMPESRRCQRLCALPRDRVLRVSPLGLLISSLMVKNLRISTGEAGRAGRIPFPRTVMVRGAQAFALRMAIHDFSYTHFTLPRYLRIATTVLGFLTWSLKLHSREETLLPADETRIRGCSRS